jgi:hypothetical protein
MLLRQISTNLKSQNWTAVALELVIVVLGIFLGLQASQWYERQQERDLESSILVRLHAEFEARSSEAAIAIQFHQDEIISLNLILRSLEAGTLDDNKNIRFRDGLQNAMAYDLGPSRSGTYIEILSSGQFRLLRDPQLRSSLSSYDDLVTKATLLFSNFQQNQRKHESIFYRHVTREPTREIEFAGAPTGVAFMHGEISELDLVAMAGDEEFLYALERLIEYHTNFQFWHGNIIRSANQVLDLLNASIL